MMMFLDFEQCIELLYSEFLLFNAFNNFKFIIMSIPAKEAIKLIAKNAANPRFKLIDVRTLPERHLSLIPNSEHIPLDQLPKQINVFDKDITYLIYCRSGKRSLTATNLLKSQGIEAINMEGGIL